MIYILRTVTKILTLSWSSVKGGDELSIRVYQRVIDEPVNVTYTAKVFVAGTNNEQILITLEDVAEISGKCNLKTNQLMTKFLRIVDLQRHCPWYSKRWCRLANHPRIRRRNRILFMCWSQSRSHHYLHYWNHHWCCWYGRCIIRFVSRLSCLRFCFLNEQIVIVLNPEHFFKNKFGSFKKV